MAINTLQYAALFQTLLDTQVLQGATSGWMEANAGDVIYNGGREIKIPEISLQGLGDYDRDNGHPTGSVSFAYRTYTMTQDRGRKFRLDENDINETNFGTSAATVMKEFQRTKVIPEVDAYRYSKLANLAGTKNVNTITAANVLPELYKQLYALADAGVDLTNIVISMSYPVYALLNTSTDISKKLDVTSFERGGLQMQVKSLDGAAIVPISSDRMKTSYLFNDGTTSGQEAGGFTAASDAAAINWIICPRSVPIAISKTDRVKIITPEVNQDADAYDLHYHKYHDLIIPYNRRKQIIVSTDKAFTAEIDAAGKGVDTTNATNAASEDSTGATE